MLEQNVKQLMLKVGRMGPEKRRGRRRQRDAEEFAMEVIPDMIQSINPCTNTVKSFTDSDISYEIEKVQASIQAPYKTKYKPTAIPGLSPLFTQSKLQKSAMRESAAILTLHSIIRLNRTVLQNYEKRPDAGCVGLKRKRIDCYVGFVEVKPYYKKKDTVKTHEVLLRLSLFAPRRARAIIFKRWRLWKRRRAYTSGIAKIWQGKKN
ncbi:hypothetical protein BDF21DRAFT_399122 [Thamnidium elegans]|nr:hypothetical protein BDF21DRAFT_399122 [Thamnidium elegans]